MMLYVDGKQVGDATPTRPAAQAYTGYWRVGGDNLGGWPNQPTQQLLRRHHRRGRDLPDRARRSARSGRTTSQRPDARRPPAPADAYGTGGLQRRPGHLLAARRDHRHARPRTRRANAQRRHLPGGVTKGSAGAGRRRRPTRRPFNGSTADGSVATSARSPTRRSTPRSCGSRPRPRSGGKLIGFGDAQTRQLAAATTGTST